MGFDSFPYTAADTDSSLFLCAATKTLCWFTATKPITFHILPLTLDSIASHVLPQRLFVRVLPKSLLLPIYCHKAYYFLYTAKKAYYFLYMAQKTYYFLYTATEPITFHTLPQSLLFSIYGQKACYFLYTATKPITSYILPQNLLLSVYCQKAYYFLYMAKKTYYFLYTATEPITFHTLPQSLLFSIYGQKACYFLYTATKHIIFYIWPKSLLTLRIFPCTATNVDCFVLGGYIACVTRFAPKPKPRGAQRTGTIAYCVAPGTYHPHICCLHHHHQNHQHLLKVQVIRVDILEDSMTF